MELSPKPDRLKYQVDAVLAEYRAMRDEIVRTIERQFRSVAVYIVGLGAAYGFMAGRERSHWDLLPFLGVFAAGFFWLYVAQSRLVTLLSLYVLEELEGRRIPALVGNIQGVEDILPISWQHFYRHHLDSSRFKLYRALWTLTLFFGLGMLPPMGYCFVTLWHYHWSCVPAMQNTVWASMGSVVGTPVICGILGIMVFACWSLIAARRTPQKKVVERQ